MSKTILIVEDNALNAKLFGDLIQATGHSTMHCSEGDEVLDKVHETRPDLVIMDIQLPHVSGLELVQILKADPETASIPVIAVTAFAMKGDEEKIIQAGADAYLSKPVAVPEFLNAVAAFLSQDGEGPP